jgi:hypothetical protein
VADIVALRRRGQRGRDTGTPGGTAVGTAPASSAVAPATAPAAGTAGAPDAAALATRLRALPVGTASALAGTAAGTGVDRLLPVLPELRPLLPGGGLRRGATVAVGDGPRVPGLPATGATSLMLALLAGASRAGSWCAVVGLPTLGALAAAEVGVALERLALVPDPGPDWSTVVAALLDGVDVVVAACPAGATAPVTRRLAARARQRGSVLVPYGSGWQGADLLLEPVQGYWHGLGPGRGRLRVRELTVRARGRGAAARSRQIRVWLPTPTGADRPVPVPGRLLPDLAPTAGAVGNAGDAAVGIDGVAV